MKYVRTKNGIYEVKKEEILCGVKFYDYETREDFVNRIREEHIIAQADTIEELCDEFVIEFEGYVPFTSDIFYIDEEHRKEELKPLAEHYKGCKNIYGAIWTSKGLIYVAKLNDKGELELL